MRGFFKGQRWVSESEPELGVGVVVEAMPGRVSLLYRATGTVRQYASASAPIKRVEFREGDTIKTHTGASVVVDSVETRADGVFVYRGGGQEVPETDLSDTLSFSKPEDRLGAGQVDDPRAFDLRLESLRRRHQIRHSPVRGFIGARIDLIPHQLSVAHDVASRLLPRVLLADEVGLGKTIEACLIMHRLFRSGRAARILILVPEPLVHQWFVEILRRFTMRVSIFDEERCQSIEAGEPGANPFLDDQVILCPLSLLAGDPKRAGQAVAAGWDLVIVDEAHHLAWEPGSPSPEYSVVESLARAVSGVILLTATPEQLGADGHFARLRLLDPDRYDDIKKFAAERSTYRKTAKIAAKILDGKSLTAADQKSLRQICQANPARLDNHLAAWKLGDSSARDALVQELLDQHGPGRVMFRNTRSAISGFPKRQVFLEPLPALENALHDERSADNSPPRSYELADDPRLDWLLRFLQKHRSEKILLICRTQEKVLALDAALRARMNVKLAMFHEGLTLLQRDRNAAWFAESDGAQLLLCSEIGSEGRNFQFAHHIVLFDLPPHPDLLEQRIGRLDRIGQTETISIHVPYPEESHLEVLARWFHEGLNAFEKSLEGGREVMTEFGHRLDAFLQGGSDDGFSEFISETRTFHARIAKEIEEGQDRLLQMNSCRPEVAARIISQIQTFDEDAGLDEFLLGLFDHYGIHVEDLDHRTWIATPASGTTESFPELPESGITLTSDRTKALSREEIGFLTWDHPIVTGAIDLLLGSGTGASSFAIWRDAGSQGIFLETVFVIEPIAPPALHADRFLPATPVRIVVNAGGQDVSSEINLTADDLEAGSIFPLLDNSRIKNKVLPAMLEKCRAHAAERAQLLTAQAVQKMRTTLGGEIERLRDLKRMNDHIRDDEIALWESQMGDLETAIAEAPLRLDALRLIWQTPEH